ncbi:host factor-I protein [Mesorhizobium sp. YR577]|nr:host factor-I protein [Mesorhizobium sp. YR577]
MAYDKGWFARLTWVNYFGAVARKSTGDRRKIRKMAERSQNLQDLFLNSVRKSKNPLTIFLINGVKLTGVVTSFDNFCVLLRRDGHSQLVYKHAISTIMPSQPVQMFDGEESNQGA